MSGDFIVFAILIVILFSWVALNLESIKVSPDKTQPRKNIYIPDDLDASWYSKAERRYGKQEEE